MGLSGALTADTNTFNGVVVKYSEPPEARKPKKRWRFYVFKGQESLPVMHLHRQSAYLIGKDRKVADIPVDHPSCSRQHAAFQYRAVERQVSDLLLAVHTAQLKKNGVCRSEYPNRQVHSYYVINLYQRRPKKKLLDIHIGSNWR